MAGRKLNVNAIWIRIMKRHKNSTHGFAVCIDNSAYPVSLELHKIYRVLPDDDAAIDGDLRAVDESGEDYLYPAECTKVLYCKKPSLGIWCYAALELPRSHVGEITERCHPRSNYR